MEKKFKLNAAMINKNRAFLLLAIVLFCGLFVDNFYTAYNIRAVTGNGSLVIWLGLGFTIVLIAGHMDMTVMYMSTFAALLTLGLHSNQKLPWAICILIGALMGVVNGLIMGLLVTKLKIHAFIASIGMQLVLKGIMYVYCNGSELSIGRDYDLNEKLNNQLLPFLPFSTDFIITTLFVILVIVILRYTRLGRNIHMVGGNAETAWLAGIHSDHVVIAAFIISGLAAGLGGALNGIYSGAANVTMGEKGISPFYMAFTATVIGGTDIYGGKGSVGWTYISLLMIAFLKSLCKSTELQVLVIGAALVLCLIYETVAKYNKDKILGRRPNLHLEHLKEMKGAK